MGRFWQWLTINNAGLSGYESSLVRKDIGILGSKRFSRANIVIFLKKQ